MKRALKAVVLALAGMGTMTTTASAVQGNRSVSMARLWDADDATAFYCRTIGNKGNNAGGSSRGGDYGPYQHKVKTSGSDTTVVSNTALSGALAPLNVGDLIVFIIDGVREEFVVLTNADDNTITINEAIDISDGSYYYYRKRECDDESTSGEFGVADLDNFQITVQVAQMGVDAGAVNVFIECRQAEGPFMVIESAAITTGGVDTDNFLTRVFANESWHACRAGVSVDDDDAGDAVVEQINIYLSGKGVVQ